MVVDWIADEFAGPVIVPPGSALRVTILKLKDEEGGRRGGVEYLKEKLDSIEEATAGENFSPERAKGFSICSMAVFRGEEELGSALLSSEMERKVEEMVMLDFTVEAPAGGRNGKSLV